MTRFKFSDETMPEGFVFDTEGNALEFSEFGGGNWIDASDLELSFPQFVDFGLLSDYGVLVGEGRIYGCGSPIDCVDAELIPHTNRYVVSVCI